MKYYFLIITLLFSFFSYSQPVGNFKAHSFKAEWIDFTKDGDVNIKVDFLFLNEILTVNSYKDENLISSNSFKNLNLNYFTYSEYLVDSLKEIYYSSIDKINSNNYNGIIRFYYEDDVVPSKSFYFKYGTVYINEEYNFNSLLFKSLKFKSEKKIQSEKELAMSLSSSEIDKIFSFIYGRYNVSGTMPIQNGYSDYRGFSEIIGFIELQKPRNFSYQISWRVPGSYVLKSDIANGNFKNGKISTLNFNLFKINVEAFNMKNLNNGSFEILYDISNGEIELSLKKDYLIRFKTTLNIYDIEFLNNLIQNKLLIKTEYKEQVEYEKYLSYLTKKQRDDISNHVIGKTFKIGKLIIANNDFEKSMTRQEAYDACASLGDGWRLPTILDLKYIDSIITSNNLNLKTYNFTYKNYWSSSNEQFSSSGELIDHSSHLISYNIYGKSGIKTIRSYIGDLNNVRPVKGLSIDIHRTIGSVYNFNSLIVAQYDYPKRVGFSDLTKVLQDFGHNEGWRFPTKKELDLLFENNSKYNLGLPKRSDFYITNEIYSNPSYYSSINIRYHIRLVRSMTKNESIESDYLKSLEKKKVDSTINSLKVLDLFSNGIVSEISESKNSILLFTNLRKITNYGVVSDFDKLEKGLTNEGWRLPNYEEMKIFKRLYNDLPEFRLKFTGNAKKTHYYFYYTTKQGLERFEVGNGYFTSPENDKQNSDFIHFFGVKDYIK